MSGGRKTSSVDAAVPKKKSSMSSGNKTQSRNNPTNRKTSRSSKAKTPPSSLAQELEEQLKYSAPHRSSAYTLRKVWDHLSDNDPDTVAWSVGVLEQSVAELELQLDSLSRGNTDDADTEFKLRYEAQTDLNAKLLEQTQWYGSQLANTKDRFRQAQQRASYNLTTLCQEYSYDADLDQYSEAELSVMVRQLERERNISYSEFRNKTWLLDSRSKEYHQLKDLCDAYSGDLSFVNRSLEEMWRKRSSGGVNAAPIIWNAEPGFLPEHRVINPRHGPVRKTAGVRSLPRLDPDALGSLGSMSSSENVRRGGARGHRTRSLDERGRRKRMAAEARMRHKSAQPAMDSSAPNLASAMSSEDITAASASRSVSVNDLTANDAEQA